MNKNISRAIWVAVAVVCTAAFLYLFIYLSYTISGLSGELALVKAEAETYGTADFIRSLHSYITTDYIILALITVIYASFSTLATEKLVALFRRPKIEHGEDIPR